MTGNLSSERRAARFLLDESLSPEVAQALALVGYEIRHLSDVLGKGTDDTEIIDWCRRNGAIWIHADDRARIEHRERLLTSGIRTLWIRRKGGAMPSQEQLRIISYVLPQLIRNYGERPRTRHYGAFAESEISRISLRHERI